MGVDEYVYIKWEDSVRKWANKKFSPNVITLTCFHESVFWIELEERDTFDNDKLMVGLACKNFQIGKNIVILYFHENEAGTDTTANVFFNSDSVQFEFGLSSNIAA